MHQNIGDVRALAADLLLDAARPRARFGERGPARELERQIRHESLVRVKEPQLGRLVTGRLAHDAGDDVLVIRDLLLTRAGPRAVLRQRLEMRLYVVDLGHRVTDRALESLRDLMGVVE